MKKKYTLDNTWADYSLCGLFVVFRRINTKKKNIFTMYVVIGLIELR